jgi:hypothetical protein
VGSSCSTRSPCLLALPFQSCILGTAHLDCFVLRRLRREIGVLFSAILGLVRCYRPRTSCTTPLIPFYSLHIPDPRPVRWRAGTSETVAPSYPITPSLIAIPDAY